MATTTHDTRIELVLADLKRQDEPNIRGTARKYQLIESTLRRRFQGKNLSRSAANSGYRQNLTFAQEQVLIGQINRMTDCRLPPTSRIVKNFAEEVIGRLIGKNWTSDFVKRV